MQTCSRCNSQKIRLRTLVAATQTKPRNGKKLTAGAQAQDMLPTQHKAHVGCLRRTLGKPSLPAHAAYHNNLSHLAHQVMHLERCQLAAASTPAGIQQPTAHVSKGACLHAWHADDHMHSDIVQKP